MAYARLPGTEEPRQGASLWQRLGWHLFNSPQAQVSGMVNWLPAGAAEELIQMFPKGRKIGEGIEQIAHLVEHPTLGKVVVKQIKQPMTYAGETWPNAVKLADEAPRMVPPTQYHSTGGKRWIFQPYVEARLPVSEASQGRLRELQGEMATPRSGIVRRLLREKGMWPIDVEHNTVYGSLQGRTRPWMVDVGGLKSAPEELKALMKSPTAGDFVNRWAGNLNVDDIKRIIEIAPKPPNQLSTQEVFDLLKQVRRAAGEAMPTSLRSQGAVKALGGTTRGLDHISQETPPGGVSRR